MNNNQLYWYQKYYEAEQDGKSAKALDEIESDMSQDLTLYEYLIVLKELRIYDGG